MLVYGRLQTLSCRCWSRRLPVLPPTSSRFHQHVHSGARSRFNSTVGSSTASRMLNRSFSVLGLTLGAMAGGLVGYVIARIPEKPFHIPESPSEPKYGCPEDFELAIKELRAAFPSEDSVSTDPDDLYTHGFSENDYHPGIQ